MISLLNKLLSKFNLQVVQTKPKSNLKTFTVEEVQEYIRCSKDPVYFINNYVKCYSFGDGLINFKLYPIQEAVVNMFEYNKLNLVKASRQSGKSSTGIFYLLHRLLFNENADIAIMSPNLSISKNLLSRLKISYDNLPSFLKQGVVFDTNNSFILENNSRVNVYKISTQAICGRTFTDIFLDEFAFVEYDVAEDFMNVLYPMVHSTISTKLMIVSTKKEGSYFNKLIDDAKTGNNKFSYIEFGWSSIYGRDEKWKKDVIFNIGEKAFNEEYEI